MSQFSEQTQKKFSELEARHERMKTLTASMKQIVKTLQEGHSQLRKASEETNKRLNLVFEEQHHSERDRDCLDKDIKKLFNVYHSMKPQPQGHIMDNPYHQDEIKPVPYEESQTPDTNSRRTREFCKMQMQPKCTLDDISNTLQDITKRTNIGKYSPYKINAFKEKQPFRVELKDKPKGRVAEVSKKKNSCHNCRSTDQYANNCPKAKKNVYSIEKVPEEESPTEDSASDSMGDAIREQSDEEQGPREEFLVEYQEETPLEIQDIQLEAGMPQNSSNQILCKHTQDAQIFLVTTTKEMEYIHGKATEMNVCIDNSQHPLIIDSGAHFSIVDRNYLDSPFPNWEKQLLPTNEKNFKSASGKMTSIRTIIKEIIIPHRKGNIRLNPEFLVFDDAHIQGFLLGAD
ncbi:hypothetical protein O181_046841 [Austropuccinia psidii MF-1]|uniref:Uncharacterized protein n=1 Tax=Austropuccinia psidii MF-1 TaxID=1389203 RepID=A0A9Q3DV08_9BASI|nr:hypothetical protein [Austropuccinia psidii MF-1]